MLGLLTIVFGFFATVMLLRTKHVVLVITDAMAPMIMKTLLVKASFDMYQLASPVLFLLGALFLFVTISLRMGNKGDTDTVS